MCLKSSVKTAKQLLIIVKYKFGEYLLHTFPVYNELMRVYIPHAGKTKK